MPYLISRLAPDGLVAVRHYGQVRVEELEGVYADLIGISRSEGSAPRVLIDVRDAGGYPDEAELFAFLHGFHWRERSAGRTAFVTTETHLKAVRFIELATGNRGIRVRVFLEESAALEWLREA